MGSRWLELRMLLGTGPAQHVAHHTDDTDMPKLLLSVEVSFPSHGADGPSVS